jgi:hypothetical protein
MILKQRPIFTSDDVGLEQRSSPESNALAALLGEMIPGRTLFSKERSGGMLLDSVFSFPDRRHSAVSDLG